MPAGSGGCGCATTPEKTNPLTPEQQTAYDALVSSLAATAPLSEPAVAPRVAPAGNGPVARVNGVALHEAGQFGNELPVFGNFFPGIL